MSVLAFDTSNYTTSVAAFDGAQARNESRLLDVAHGTLGLRQSDALFSHIKRLPELTDRLFSLLPSFVPEAVGASTRPRAVEGSYMPCFLAGATQAQVMARTLSVPFYAFSHQQGHIAAALFSSGHMELMDTPPPCAASSHSASSRSPRVFAMTSRKRPVPAEHLSFIRKSLTRPFSSRMILVSCPPMSITVSAGPP